MPGTIWPWGPTAYAGKLVSGTALRTPGKAASFAVVPSGSQTRSASGFALCFSLTLPFFFLMVVWWTFWSAPTMTGAAA